MKNTAIIVIISILTAILMCVGIYIALTPVVQPVLPPPPDPFPANELANIKALDIVRPNTLVPKRLVIRNYTDGLAPEHINALPSVSYRILTQDSKNYMLFVPYQIGGTLTVRPLIWDSYLEKYVPDLDDEKMIINEEITENYALLLQYDRPEVAKYELKITQGEDTVTYRIHAPTGAKISPKEEFPADRQKESEYDVVYQESSFSQQSTYVAPVTTTVQADNNSSTMDEE